MNKKNIKILMLGILLFSIFSGSAIAKISKSRANELFIQAGGLYQSGKYSEAIAKYEEILEGDRESGALYYNLGNSYYKEKAIGKAILNYQRAKRLIPRDRDLVFNQRYALTQAGVLTDSVSLSFVGKMFERHIQFYTKEEMVAMITLLSLLGLSFFMGSFYLNVSKKIRVLIISFFLAGVFIFVSGFVLKCAREGSQAVIIKKGDAFFEPRANATVYYSLKEGEIIKIQQEQDDWIKVKRSDGRLGWIQSVNIEGI